MNRPNKGWNENSWWEQRRGEGQSVEHCVGVGLPYSGWRRVKKNKKDVFSITYIII